AENPLLDPTNAAGAEAAASSTAAPDISELDIAGLDIAEFGVAASDTGAGGSYHGTRTGHCKNVQPTARAKMHPMRCTVGDVTRANRNSNPVSKTATASASVVRTR